MSPRTDQELQTRARALYRRAAAEVDTATAARLRQARRTALEARSKPHLGRWMVPAGAVAACLLAVVVIWPWSSHTPTRPATASHAVAADSDAASLPPDPETTDPALYQDMDFYAWLANQPATTRHARGG